MAKTIQFNIIPTLFQLKHRQSFHLFKVLDLLIEFTFIDLQNNRFVWSQHFLQKTNLGAIYHHFNIFGDIRSIIFQLFIQQFQQSDLEDICHSLSHVNQQHFITSCYQTLIVDLILFHLILLSCFLLTHCSINFLPNTEGWLSTEDHFCHIRRTKCFWFWFLLHVQHHLS